MATALPTPRKEGPWLLLKWLIPLFAVVFIVNGIMVYKAETTFNGLTTEHAYEKGLAYNQTLQAQATQAKLGWAFTTSIEGNTYTLKGLDAAGQPLSGATVSAQFIRPTNTGQDQTIAFTETTPGTYTAPLGGLAKGQWNTAITISRPQPEGATPDTFNMNLRLILTP